MKIQAIEKKLQFPRNASNMKETNLGSKKYSAGLLRVLLLSELSAGENHGYALARRLRIRSGQELQVAAGNLYPVLYKMEADGLATSRWIEGGNGRFQKVYALTDTGIQAAEPAVSEFIQLTKAMLTGF